MVIGTNTLPPTNGQSKEKLYPTKLMTAKVIFHSTKYYWTKLFYNPIFEDAISSMVQRYTCQLFRSTGGFQLLDTYNQQQQQ